MDHRLDRASRERELRVEGVWLFVAAAVLVVLLGGAFYLGRWVERGSGPGQGAGLTIGAPDPVAGPAEPESEVTYFDTVEGDEKALEPERQTVPAAPTDAPVARTAAPGAAPTPAEPAGTPAVREAEPPAGPFYVQVFAGRDARSADGLIQSLRNDGFPVRLDAIKEGGSVLHKVRVGGFPTEDEARTAAETLRRRGYSGAWVTRVD